MTTALAQAVAGWHPAPIETPAVIDARPLATFAAMLDVDSPVGAPGDAIPPMWQAFSFTSQVPQRDLGADGHPESGYLLPPVPRRRRMFAGGRYERFGDIRVGDRLVRRSEISRVDIKVGRSGEMLFVVERHEFLNGRELVAVEEQDLVYRQQEPGASRGVPVDGVLEPAEGGGVGDRGPWMLLVAPDPVLLFRFSALTANAHRIHYDHPYATQVEGYPDLVVHGPLLALLLLELPRRNLPGRPVRAFTYRLRRPAFAGRPLLARANVHGAHLDLHAGPPQAEPAITATATVTAG